MKISPIKDRKKVITVHEAVGRALIKKGKFVEVGTFEVPAAQIQPVPEVKVMVAGKDVEVEISERTGLPKRQYRRRDMEAE